MKDPALVEAIRQIALLNAEIATLRAALDGLVAAGEEILPEVERLDLSEHYERGSVPYSEHPLIEALRAALAAAKEATK